MKVNDGQLELAKRYIEQLEQSRLVLQDVCARRLELLKRVSDCQIGHPAIGVRVLIVDDSLWDEVESETDENEVQT